MKLQLEFDIDCALAGLQNYFVGVTERLSEVGRSASAEMEAFAKQNRPWTDRTGNARRTMEGVCGWNSASAQGSASGDVFSVGVEGHMPYSVFLELGYGGKYSVLAPTVHHFAPDILLSFAGCLNSVR